MLGERVRGLQWLSILCAAFGLIAIIQPWHLYGSMVSNVLAIATGAVWGLGAIMVKRLQLREPMDLISMTAWQMVFGVIPLAIVATLVPEAPVVWTGRYVLVLIFVGIFTTGFGWLLWVYALDNLPAGTASLATLTAPVIAMLTSSYHFGEQPNSIEIAGMVLIASALLILSIHAMRIQRAFRKTGVASSPARRPSQ